VGITYCEKWWLSKKRPLNSMDEKTAKIHHNKRKPYVAVLSKHEQPQYVVDVAGKWVSVIFLDDFIRPYLRYDFKELKKGKIFLTAAMHWEYEEESDVEVSSKNFSFAENGDTLMADWDRTTGDLVERKGNFSVKRNWDNYPEFGEYLYLCKEDRE